MIALGSLFAGIGGLELGLGWALAEAGIPHRVAWQVEREPFPRQVLARHWPHADRSIADVCLASRANLAAVDLVCGGFPCQDLSFSGKGAGIAEGTRSGLWFEFARVVRELQPWIVVVENVGALRSRGLGVVLGDLAEAGYDAEWRCLRASDVGAPHERERLFIVAHANGREPQRDRAPGDVPAGRGTSPGARSERQRDGDAAGNGGADLADAHGEGRGQGARCARTRGRPDALGSDPLAHPPRSGQRPRGHSAPPGQPDVDGRGAVADAASQGRSGAERRGAAGGGARPLDGSGREGAEPEPRMGGAAHGLPGWVDRWPAGPGQAQHPWEAPRVAQGVTNRAARLKALGNAVVPAVAREVGRLMVVPLLAQVLR